MQRRIPGQNDENERLLCVQPQVEHLFHMPLSLKEHHRIRRGGVPLEAGEEAVAHSLDTTWQLCSQNHSSWAYLHKKRPVQEQANQHSSMDGRESLEAPLLALTATDERGRRGGLFSSEVWSLVGCSYFSK